MLHEFLEQDRIFAAYAIADTDDSEFDRTRWGIAFDDGAPGGGGHGVPRHLAPAALRHGRRRTASAPSCVTSSARASPTSRPSPRSCPRCASTTASRHRRRWCAWSSTERPSVRCVGRRRPARPGRHRAPQSPLPAGPHLRTCPSRRWPRGIYYGVRRGTRLIAAAGTHVISPQSGIAAVGNVYTHREYRGQGLAKVVTSAVTADLLRDVRHGGAQRARRQPAGAGGLSRARLSRAHPLRGAARPPPNVALG